MQQFVQRGNRRRGQQGQGGPPGLPGSDGGTAIGNWVEGLYYQNEQFMAGARDLVHPGKNPAELLMRTFLLDAEEANAVVSILHGIDEFRMPKSYQDYVLHWLASRRSIGGRSTDDLKQVLVGALVSSWDNQSYQNRRKNGQKPQQDDQQDQNAQ